MNDEQNSASNCVISSICSRTYSRRSVAICSLRLRPVCSLYPTSPAISTSRCLDVVVHVLDRRIVGLGHAFARDLIEREQRCRQFFAGQDAGLCQSGRVRLAGRNLVRQQHAVERKRPLPLLELRIRRLAEAA